MTLYALSFRLGVTIDRLRALSVADIAGYIAFQAMQDKARTPEAPNVDAQLLKVFGKPNAS